MKLSENGLGKIQRWQSTVALGFPMHPSEIDFEPHDFQGAVVLTVEEAKEILQSSYDLLSWANCPCIQEDKALEIQSYLKERIEQAEMSKQST